MKQVDCRFISSAAAIGLLISCTGGDDRVTTPTPLPVVTSSPNIKKAPAEQRQSDGSERLLTSKEVANFTTNFPRVESPISEGNRWVNGKSVGLDWNDPQTVPGKAFASVRSGLGASRYDDSVAHLTTAFTENQYAQATVFRAPGYRPGDSKHEIELLLRFRISAHYSRGYEIMWGHSGYLAIARWNGPLGKYTALYDPGDPGIGQPADGDVLRAEIRGDIIKVYKNGTSVAAVNVTAPGGEVWKDGQPGMGLWPVDRSDPSSFGWKNYEAGSL